MLQPGGCLPSLTPIRQEVLLRAGEEPTHYCLSVGRRRELCSAQPPRFVFSMQSWACRRYWSHSGERELMVCCDVRVSSLLEQHLLPKLLWRLHVEGVKQMGHFYISFPLEFLLQLKDLGLLGISNYISAHHMYISVDTKIVWRIIQNPQGCSLRWLLACHVLFILIEYILRARLMCFLSL